MYSLDNNFQYRRDDNAAEKDQEEKKDEKQTKVNNTFAML